jgi:DNA-binding NtrC family response regulator
MSLEFLRNQARQPHVLVILSSNENRDPLLKAIGDSGAAPLVCSCLEEAHEALRRENIRVIVCEDLLPRNVLDAVLDLAHYRPNRIPVIVASRTGEWNEFLACLDRGAFDYLVLPPKPLEVKRVLDLALGEAAHVDRHETAYDFTDWAQLR